MCEEARVNVVLALSHVDSICGRSAILATFCASHPKRVSAKVRNMEVEAS